MQNEIESRLRLAQQLESSGTAEQAIAAYLSILEQSPQLIHAHLRLSELRQRLGQYRQSRAHLQGAIDSLAKTRRWEALPFVTLRLLAFEERLLIRDLILSADQADREVIRQSPTLSQHLWLSGAYEEALQLIKRASALVQPSPMLSYSRANALRYSGRTAEATEELERCLAMAPNYPFAHWTLAYHARSEQPGARVDRIRKAQAAMAGDEGAQVYLNYALFKELDDAGETAAAWPALAEGARLKRKSIAYDGAHEAAALAAMRNFAEGASSVAPGSPVAAHAPIFVVGLPRTGTTLLERILSNHAQVASAGELGDFSQSLSWSLDQFVGSPPGADAVQRLRGLDYTALGQRYLDRTAAHAAGRGFVVDKNPSNVFHAWTIARAMPSARILCLVREPMDACFSNLKELFTGSAYGYSYDLAELAAHHREFARTVACWQALLPGQFMVVGYEDLVADPDAVAARVTQFCGLPAQAGLADISRNLSPVLTASAAQVQQPIHERNVGAWSRYAAQLQPLRERLDSP